MNLKRQIAICIAALSCAPCAAASLCKADEITFSSCSVGKKIASFCVSRGSASSPAYIQYRFGTLSKIELVVPADTKQSKGVFFNSMHTYTDGSEMRLSFRQGAYRYI